MTSKQCGETAGGVSGGSRRGEGDQDMTDERRAQLASALHALPFKRDEWAVKIDNLLNQMAVLSMAKTGLPDHPAYVAVENAVLAYCRLRFRDYGTPPSGFTMLIRAAKAPKETVAMGRAFEAMELVDAEYVTNLRELMMADMDGATARKLAR
jgi:hypothetical protein